MVVCGKWMLERKTLCVELLYLGCIDYHNSGLRHRWEVCQWMRNCGTFFNDGFKKTEKHGACVKWYSSGWFTKELIETSIMYLLWTLYNHRKMGREERRVFDQGGDVVSLAKNTMSNTTFFFIPSVPNIGSYTAFPTPMLSSSLLLLLLIKMA